MGVAQYSDYIISNHAAERIKQRFAIPEKDLPKWITRILQNANYISKLEQNRAKYKFGEIVIILDETNKIVVTVFPEFVGAESSLTSQTNPEIKSAINHSLEDFVSMKKSKVVYQINGIVIKLYDQFRLLNHGLEFDEFKQTLSCLNKKIEKADLVIEEAEQIINNKR